MQMKKRVYLLFIALVFCGLIACSSEESQTETTDSPDEASSDQVEISFVAAQYSNETEPFLRQLVEDFESEHPDIKVNLDVIGWDALEQQVNTMISTNQMPDILNINHYSSFVGDDLLYPIDEIISDDLKAKLYDSFLAAGQMDGTQYAIPFLASIRGLYYNKAIFEQAGIESPPETWQELRETAKKIKEETGIDGFGVPMTTFEGQAYFSYFTWGNGGDWKKGDEWSLNSPENVEGMEFLRQLVREDKVTNPEPTAINRDELQKVFGAGQLGMMITANFLPTILANDFPDLEYGVAPIPYNEGKEPFNLGVQDFLMVFKTVKHPEAVGTFLDFFYEDERYEQFMKLEGMLPATETAGENMAAKDELIAQFVEQLPLAKFYPLSDPKFAEIRLELVNAVQQILLDEKTAQDALDDLQSFAEK